MKTSITFLLFLLLTVSYSYAQPQNWQWAKRVGTVNDNNGNPFNPTYNEAITDVKADKYGNVYAVGYFYPNPTFVNATSGLPTTGGYGGSDAYLIKYNSCGNVLWWRRMGGTSDDKATSLALNGNGQVIIAGECVSSTYTIGDGVHDTILNNGNITLFIAKYDTAGHFINASNYPTFSTAPYTDMLQIFINSQGNYFLSNGLSSYVIPSSLGAITATYNYVAPTPFCPQIVGITLDKNDNVYLSGAYSNTINIGGGTTLIPNSGLKSLIIKFSPNGIMLWHKTDNNTSVLSTLLNCAIDTSGTRIVVGGNAENGANVFGYVVNVPPNHRASTFYWLDAATGNLISGITGTYNVASVASLHPHYTNRDDSVHFKGKVIGSVTFNTTTYTSTAASGGQSCIGKISATSSSFVSINMLPQSGSQYETINGLDVNEQGNIYIGGMFGGTLDSAGTAVNIIGGSEDGFVAKYGFACNSSSTSLSPLPPTSLAAVYQATLTNYVTWIDNAQYENSYELWYNTNSNPTFSLLATLPANTISYTHTSLAYNTTYCYKARAVNNIGASFFTNVGCATTPTNGGGTGTAPNAPLNLTATNNGSLTNNVAWTDNSNNEDNFELHYTFGSNPTYSLLATLPANTTSYTHTGLSYTTTYCYKVAATNSAGSSAFSNTACATTPANGTGVEEFEVQSLKLKVYPNPAKSEIYFDIPSNEKQINVELYNTLGSLVLSKKNYTNRSAISISTLSKGLYYYKVILPKGEFAGKVVKEE
ncbi:MAG: T9SS type A sorting domain-containing protein [Bacteroidetes bacterium]|nr:T9SS type A sorting domain-containing protein [Bacteroidota bacterium]